MEKRKGQFLIGALGAAASGTGSFTIELMDFFNALNTIPRSESPSQLALRGLLSVVALGLGATLAYLSLDKAIEYKGMESVLDSYIEESR